MLDWHIILSIISGIIALLAVIPYVKDILHGTTRPNIVSWALWDVLLLISVWAQFSAGASWSVIFLIGDIIGTSIILILALVGYGYKKHGHIEWVCLLLALIAIISWQATSQPLLAIIFAALADFMAAIPTIVKAFKDPWSEDPPQFLLIAFASVLGIIALTIFNPENIIFPAYLFGVNVTIGLIALVGRRLKQTK